MRPKDENKEQAIRQKAIEMIVAEGFDGLSMHKLARAVNISVSTIYVYFENREDLLRRLFAGVEEHFEVDALRGFSPTLSLQEGLWLQWVNRLGNIRDNPTAFRFHEQYRNSPLIHRNGAENSVFRRSMTEFFEHLVRTRQIKKVPVEVFWAIAYGPFYTLVQFHLSNASMMGTPFALTEGKLKTAFQLVTAALQQ